MTMEKRGVIEEGLTPPETPEQREADLGEHLTKRAADAAASQCRCGCTPSCRTPNEKKNQG